MSSSGNVYFHIGLPKSASTTLQKRLFTQLPSFDNLALYPTNNIAGTNKVTTDVNNVYLRDPKLFHFYKSLHNRPDVTIDDLKQMWNDLQQEHCCNEKILLSHEAITSAFFSSISVDKKLQRVYSLFPKVKICLVLRKQRTWLHSQYTDHPFIPTNLGAGRPCTFDEWIDIFLNDPKLKAARNNLDYYRLVDYCYSLFGRENVDVIRFEWLKEEPRRFYNAWATYLDVSNKFVAACLHNKQDNRGVSAAYNYLRKLQRQAKIEGRSSAHLDNVLKMSLLKHLPRARYSLRADTLEKLNGFYLESNEKLNKLLGW